MIYVNAVNGDTIVKIKEVRKKDNISESERNVLRNGDVVIGRGIEKTKEGLFSLLDFSLVDDSSKKNRHGDISLQRAGRYP